MHIIFSNQSNIKSH